MTLLEASGYLAAVCTTAAYVPQTVKAWRSKSTRDVSLGMIVVLVIGLGLWLAYGFGKGDIPLMVANGITLALAGTILILKLRHG